MKHGRFRFITVESDEVRARTIADQSQCGYDLRSEWQWGGKVVLMFERRVG